MPVYRIKKTNFIFDLSKGNTEKVSGYYEQKTLEITGSLAIYCGRKIEGQLSPGEVKV